MTAEIDPHPFEAIKFLWRVCAASQAAIGLTEWEADLDDLRRKRLAAISDELAALDALVASQGDGRRAVALVEAHVKVLRELLSGVATRDALALQCKETANYMNYLWSIGSA